METQLGQAACLFDAFRVAVERLSQALQRQTSSSYSNKHSSQEENKYTSSSSPHQHHPHYRVSDDESAKMLASAQGLAEDLKRI